jgi:hypothetical protein
VDTVGGGLSGFALATFSTPVQALKDATSYYAVAAVSFAGATL